MAINLRYMWKKKTKSEDTFTPIKRQFALGVFLYFVCPIVLLSSFAFIFSQNQRFVEEKITKLEKKANFLIKMNQNKEKYMQKFAKGDPEYLQKYVEPMPLLTKDKELLSEIKQDLGAAEYKPLQERLKFLEGDKNRIAFKYSQNSILLERPVEVDARDIAEILSLVEGVSIGELAPHPSRPDIAIKKIHLIKKENCDEHEIFTLDLELLQRGKS